MYRRSTSSTGKDAWKFATTTRMRFHSAWSFIICIILPIYLELIASVDATSPKRLYRVPRHARVTDSYFVHLNPGMSWSKVEELTESLQVMNDDQEQPELVAKVQGVVTQAAFGFSAQLSPQAMEKVLSHEAVDSVQEDQYIYAGSVRSWGLDRIDQESLPTDSRYNPPCGLTGEGVDVYVMDSGISYSHSDFGGRAQYPGCDLIDLTQGDIRNYNGSDCTGHGTSIAGIIGSSQYGVAPGTNIFSVRILNCNHIGTTNTVVQGIECIMNHTKTRNRSAVVNMSIYGEKDRMIKRAIEKLLRRDITVVTIAGNTPENERPKDACKLSPAALKGVITVSASTILDQAFERTNAGACVHLFAPGENILSTSYVCNTCSRSKSGSSMAAPHVTGAVALLLEKCPHLPPWKVKHHLLSQMTVVNSLDMSAIPGRLQPVTPNLLLNLNDAMCSLQC